MDSAEVDTYASNRWLSAAPRLDAPNAYQSCQAASGQTTCFQNPDLCRAVVGRPWVPRSGRGSYREKHVAKLSEKLW